MDYEEIIKTQEDLRHLRQKRDRAGRVVSGILMTASLLLLCAAAGLGGWLITILMSRA